MKEETINGGANMINLPKLLISSINILDYTILFTVDFCVILK